MILSSESLEQIFRHVLYGGAALVEYLTSRPGTKGGVGWNGAFIYLPKSDVTGDETGDETFVYQYDPETC